MEYIKIKPMFGLRGIAKVSKYEGVKEFGMEFHIGNILETIWYSEDTIKIYRYEEKRWISIDSRLYRDKDGIIKREPAPEVEVITRKEYYDVINQLKTHRIIDHIDPPKEPYMLDVVNSTNTNIIYVPKIGFEVGYKKVYSLEWFDTLGAAYPMPHLVPFVNQPYEIKVNTKKYKGFRFLPEESTTEKSVYQVIWPRKREFKKSTLVYR